jgi:hypothetical protein
MTSPGVKYDAAANYQAQAERITRLLALLREIEWAGGGGRCPACFGDCTHVPGCELAAELHQQG